MVSWEVFMWTVLCCDSVQNSSLARGDVRQSSCSSFLPSSCSSTKPYGKLSLIFIKLFVVLIVEWTGKCTFFELRSRYISISIRRCGVLLKLLGVCSSLLWLIKHFEESCCWKLLFCATTIALEQMIWWYMKLLIPLTSRNLGCLLLYQA